jgi:colanic acid/amylovoran/stewartan biosynthesis glycosyltransferase WcaL/AmsK/CpsK
MVPRIEPGRQPDGSIRAPDRFRHFQRLATSGGQVRVAFVVGSFPQISETFILDQMTGLIDRGHDVMILARPPGVAEVHRHAALDEYDLMRRAVYWDSTRGGRGAVLSRTARLFASHPIRTAADLAGSLRRRARGENLVRLWSRVTMTRIMPRPDVLLAEFGTNGVMAQQVRDICGLNIPLVATFLGYDLSRVLRERGPGFYARLFAAGDLMLPLSNHFQDLLISNGCPPQKIRIHRLGVDTVKFAFRERTRDAGAATRFVSVCRLVEKKGIETGLRAFAVLQDRVPAATWDIVGDGPLRSRLEELRAELSLEERVTLHGAMPRERVRRLLDESHILLAPSVTASDGDQEGTPVAIMEAMASGLPVISTLHSGIPELVQDGVTGLLTPERDVGALADALRKLALAPDLWAEMGRRGRAVIQREYDVQVLNDGLEEILRDLTAHRAERSVRTADSPG